MGDTERGGKRIAGGANRQQGLSSDTTKAVSSYCSSSTHC